MSNDYFKSTSSKLVQSSVGQPLCPSEMCYLYRYLQMNLKGQIFLKSKMARMNKKVHDYIHKFVITS